MTTLATTAVEFDLHAAVAAQFPDSLFEFVPIHGAIYRTYLCELQRWSNRRVKSIPWEKEVQHWLYSRGEIGEPVRGYFDKISLEHLVQPSQYEDSGRDQNKPHRDLSALARGKHSVPPITKSFA